MTSLDRARGALAGLALGDALGMPTQSMSPAEIAEDYGAIRGLVAAGPRQRIAAGMPAGSVTDDTEQALLLGRMLVDGRGGVDPREFATRLIDWERDMAERGSLDLLGPSTKAAVEKLLAGASVEESGRTGTTNGAAMRVTPVGIATPSGDEDALVDAVVAASAVTHATSLGIGAAAAIAAAVSAGVGGANTRAAVEAGIRAARAGERRGIWVAGGSIAERARWAIDLLAPADLDERIRLIREVVGTSVASQESVVAALALVALDDDPWRTLCTAAELGGDTDTIAAMAGAVLGATHGIAVWPEGALGTVVRVNDLDLDRLAAELVALRELSPYPTLSTTTGASHV